MKGIYKYTDLKTGEIVYVGKDSHIDKNIRHKNHLSPSRYNNQPFNRVLQNNAERYDYSVLYCSDSVSDDDLNMLEMSFIERYNPIFNFTKGGDGSIGYKHTKETKKKMSENNARYWKDKTLSEEHKIELSKSQNTTGYYRVHKQKRKLCKQGFSWRYNYYEDGKQKHIDSVDIKKLEEKVKAKGLEWRCL